MNTAKIYTEAVTPVEQAEAKQDESTRASIINEQAQESSKATWQLWLAATNTQKFLADLERIANDMQDNIVAAAVTQGQMTPAQLSILIQSKTIKNIITYANTRVYSNES